MKLIAVLMICGLAGCCCNPPPVKSPPSEWPPVYPVNVLDEARDTPMSTHCGEVTPLVEDGDFKLADGRVVHLFFTGGSSPGSIFSGRGRLCALVPSYGSHGHVYYFISFQADVDKRQP